MGIVLLIIALATGAGVGFFFQDPLIILVVTGLLAVVYITFKRMLDVNPQTGTSLQDDSLPASIFRTEFDEFEFTDDRRQSSLKKTLFTFLTYIAGVLVGDKLLPILLDLL